MYSPANPAIKNIVKNKAIRRKILFLNFCGFHKVDPINTPQEIRKNGITTDKLSIILFNMSSPSLFNVPYSLILPNISVFANNFPVYMQIEKAGSEEPAIHMAGII